MKNSYDIIIVGMGPAGVSAALYAHRAGADVLVIGGESNALDKAEKIDNYYGVPKGTSGPQLFEMGVNQLKDNNIDTVEGQVVSIEWYGDFAVKTVENLFTAKSVILATGTARRAPKIEGLKEFEGRGVSYCAVCDGFFYRGKTVAVLGEGEYAAEEAAYLKNLAEKVYILTNGQQPKTVIDGVEYIGKKLAAVRGETTVQSVKFEDGSSIEASGLFVAVGVAGAGDFARKLGVELNGSNIVTDEKCATNIPGFYAAGDNLGGMLQVAKAVYQGAVAGSESAKFVRSMKG
ncbi:MAG: NAD(P)/FAD-dependent oxidoreductase [Oscillospiraceae bacterium]|nr:NAD(P)/FAD-dependent oxidoreductase [Oscillospiraceae bacterium]